ncbi:MAG: M2 family metallopeptidase [Dokdonella sp.]|uniref:M2 family metallopeptidase n=1 Tax=Dokdonella sp. TaxID=2291710 RepID=UPI002BD1F21C|nr:M2 family metallopeptidase [Dokdonella sp.]HQW76775.1 M2 family metallopeptidase [Dokdonella sp.]HQX65601.1 M2 family metallopeptidase [Dokdonella sp.]HQY55391.1 M2 family metallopeptidase [Dokdonella sp.]HQZ62263.1 M2 family metallopeptidase [Dokdonella sp.]
MKLAVLVPTVVGSLILLGCGAQPTRTETIAPAATEAVHAADADAFVAGVNQEIRDHYVEDAAAQWVAATYITADTGVLEAKSSERSLIRLKNAIDASHRFDGVSGISAESARGIEMLKRQSAMPTPKDPAHLAEMATLASRLGAAYGSGKSCKDPADPATCRNLNQLSEVLADSRDWNEDLEAWQGWHSVGRGMRADYQRFAELLNEGARDTGYADAGQAWRSGYDMDPAALRAETDRLWGQVKPLYSQLQCYVRGRLEEKYPGKMPKDGTIPAHVTGNMWAQDWSALYPLVQPYPGISGVDVTKALKKQKYTPEKMVRSAEDFYRSLGMPALPASFFERSQFVRPRDRDVVCHASAWDTNLEGDVRIKMCITPTEEDFRTIYHELGHIYYYLAYNKLPPLFQTGAHDGFHEAIGDTVQLNLTPAYLHQIGLAGIPRDNEKAVINAQMQLALEKIAFLPFGKLIDEWRWGVFDGSIAAQNYNAAWWQLRQKYQGVSAPVARTEEDFDPGAKYHVPANTPYMRYFLAHILQFQFQRSLCEAAGFNGPLHDCSVYGNKQAGEKFWAMLGKGGSQPWPQTLKELTGSEQMDASAIIDYFAPLYGWLEKQNAGKDCGWQG